MIGGDSFNEDLPEPEDMVYMGVDAARHTDKTAHIAFDEIDENAERIRAALRKLDALDPDVTAAGEALGFFIYKARKDVAW